MISAAENTGRQLHDGEIIPLASHVQAGVYSFRRRSDHHPEGQGLSILCAGREECLAEYRVSRTRFPCSLVEFVVSGKGTLRFNRRKYELYPGVVFTYGMNMSHDLCSDSEHPMTKFFVAYRTLPGWNDPLHASVSDAGNVRWVRDIELLRSLFDQLIREGRRSGPLSMALALQYLALILYKTADAAVARDAQSAAAAEAYGRVVAYIELHYAEIASLGDLRRRLGLNESYVCRLFQRFGDETPIQCVTRHKLNRAAELLLSQGDSISEIARRVGYQDPFYFSRLFRKRFGAPPSAFRDAGTVGVQGL
jgi:AraC-like DNA-binding protein